MELLHHALLVLHLLGWAVTLGGLAVSIRARRVPAGALHGVLTAVVTGLLLVVVGMVGLDRDYDDAKLGVKLVVALAAAAVVLYGQRRPEKVTGGLLGAALGLTALNVVVAVFW